MLVYNYGKGIITLCKVGPGEYGLGGEDQGEIVLQYSYFALFWIFGIAFKKKYLVVNQYKNVVRTLQYDELNDQARQGKVPFMRQYGLFIFAAVIAVLGASGVLK